MAPFKQVRVNQLILFNYENTRTGVLREVSHVYTVKPVNKGHPRERQNMVFIDKWPFIGGYFVLFYH